MVSTFSVSPLLRKLCLSQAKQTSEPNVGSPDTKFSDTLDYESFPNFETSHGPRFEELSRYIPNLSVRYLKR